VRSDREHNETVRRVAEIVKRVMGLPHDKAMKIARAAVVR
jgi:hypothetical protein